MGKGSSKTAPTKQKKNTGSPLQGLDYGGRTTKREVKRGEYPCGVDRSRSALRYGPGTLQR